MVCDNCEHNSWCITQQAIKPEEHPEHPLNWCSTLKEEVKSWVAWQEEM